MTAGCEIPLAPLYMGTMRQLPSAILAIDTTPFAHSVRLVAAIRALRGALPDAFVAVAAATGTTGLLQATRLADDTIDLGEIKTTPSPRQLNDSLKRGLRLFERTRHRDFDLVLDFFPKLDTQILSRFVMRARTITPMRMPKVIEMLMGGAATVSQGGYEGVLRQIGVEVADRSFGIHVPDAEHSEFEALLHRSGYRGGEPIVVLYAADAGQLEGWPVERFVDTAQRLMNAFGARIVVLDEPGARSFNAAVGGRLPKSAISLAEPRALQFVAAVARASVLITDASAIAEMAAEISTPVIEIAGAQAAENSASEFHRIIRGSSRGRIASDDVYELACVLIQSTRSSQLFR